jgi:5-formyltetrahydrofolate cyclo-ligase
MDKVLFRQMMIKRRNQVKQEDVLEKSRFIERSLTDHVRYQQANNILLYVSYGNEVNTHHLIQKALENGRTICVPISDIKTRTLHIAHLISWDDLAPGAYGILEPKKDKQRFVSLDHIDLIIVPGVAFDRKGNRLGHGKGYYDWLISQIPNVYSIGLAFSFQIVERIPVEPKDRAVDLIITEHDIIKCSRTRSQRDDLE